MKCEITVESYPSVPVVHTRISGQLTVEDRMTTALKTVALLR